MYINSYKTASQAVTENTIPKGAQMNTLNKPARADERKASWSSTICTLVVLVLLVAVGCSSNASTTSAPTPSTKPTSSPKTSAVSPLVGQWQINQTCAGMVRALTRAHRLDLIRYQLSGFVDGWKDGAPPPGWTPRRPCAHATPPQALTHTFWVDGSFTSSDENGEQVHEGTYQLIDDHTFRFSPLVTMNYQLSGYTLTMNPVVPENCTEERIVGVEHGRDVSCLEDFAWAFSVAWPGAQWTRVTPGSAGGASAAS